MMSDCTCAMRSVMRCTCTICVVRVGVFCLHPLSAGKFISQPTETGPNSEKNHEWSDGEECQEPNFLSSNCCVPQLWTRTMATKATSFPAPVYGTSNPFEDRPHCRILQFLRTLVLFFVSLVGFEEWFYIPAGSLPYVRRVISCIIFSLVQIRVIDLSVSEHHPDSILESIVLSFEFSQLLLRRIYDFPRPFCQIAFMSCSVQPMRVNESLYL